MADDDDQKRFDKQLAKEQASGRNARLESEPPIGMQPDGTIKLLKPGERDDADPEIIGAEEDDLRSAYEANAGDVSDED